jgi:hypothetical protein
MRCSVTGEISLSFALRTSTMKQRTSITPTFSQSTQNIRDIERLVQSPNPVKADDLADPVQRRVSQESHQTLSLCVPVNSLRPMSFATSACTVSLVGVWALIAVFTIGTSIR